jgi:hypothetical protein
MKEEEDTREDELEEEANSLATIVMSRDTWKRFSTPKETLVCTL